jgi:tetratricopeptide (TPR) repeat protein
VKKPQWITISVAILLVIVLYRYGRTVPHQTEPGSRNAVSQTQGFSIDSFLLAAKKQLNPEQVMRINTLENSISRGDVKNQAVSVFHQLAHFWADSGQVFEPYAWYEAEAARLENSEKSLTFAARLFLDNLQEDNQDERRKWKALQAKDLFERSLKINPDNDSAKVGLGACYLFGNISAAPMEGILKIREVVDKDSTNVYGQMMLVKGSLFSGQYDKAISRLETINRVQPGNMETLLMLADTYERTGDKKSAILWYEKSLPFIIGADDLKAAIRQRVEALKEKIM